MSDSGRAIVVGGGVAGSVAALALCRTGFSVTLLEARPATRAGAAVRVNPNGMDALRAVGAAQAVLSVSSPLLRSERCGARGRLGYRLTADPSGEQGLPRIMAWADLTRAVQREATRAGAVIRNDARVRAAEQTSSSVRALLADGTEITGDVLVGADGPRSTVRSHIDPAAAHPQHTGRCTVRGFTPDPSFEPPPPEVLRGYVQRGFFGATRDSLTGGCYWFTTLATGPLADGEADDRDLWRERLLDHFGEDHVPAAAAVLDAERILAFDDCALPHLAHWHSERAVVIGDAAHAMTPGSGQGVATALEDGVELALCLRDNTGPARASGTADALAAFERRRRQRVQAAVALGLPAARRPERLVRWARERAAAVGRRRVLDIGGADWTYDHHIDWDQPHR